MEGVTTTVLLLILCALLSLPYLHTLLQQPSAPSICLVNLANNPRTASLFSRGMLEEHGSVNTFSVVTPTEGCHPSSERLQLVTHNQLGDWCFGTDICILTGDEECEAPGIGLSELHEYLLHSHLFPIVPETAAAGYLKPRPSLHDEEADDYFDEVIDEVAERFEVHDEFDTQGMHSQSELQHLAIEEGIQLLRPNIILREFYSSKYDYPAVALGARFEFLRVAPADRDKGNRRYLFNFMGSVKVGQERDREHLVQVYESHDWNVSTHFRHFDDLVRNPDTSTVDEYRETLLSSSFTLAPVGTADDCFRFWEAIEAGSIPIYVRRMGNAYKKHKCPDAFEDVLASNPPIVLLKDWDELPSFAETVTEAEIEDLRKRMVVWARQWWTKTASTVDDAIARAFVAKKESLKMSPEKLAFRTKEVTAALGAAKDQQKIANAASSQSSEQDRAKKQADAEARRQKRDHVGAAEELQLEQNQHIAEELRTSTSMSDKQIKQALDRLEAAAQAIGGGDMDKTLVMLTEATGLEIDEDMLRRPTFEWVHETIVSILDSTNYLSGFFAKAEYNSHSQYMQYPINRANFLNKVIKAVARDLHLPPLFANAQNILDKSQSERTRLLLCFIVEAAKAQATKPLPSSKSNKKQNNNKLR